MKLTDTTILKEACIVGINLNWDNTGGSGNKLSKVDDTFYTYSFISESTSQQFSIVEVSGSWDSRWCGNNTAKVPDDPATTTIEPEKDFADMVYSTEADPTHVQIKGLSINSEYKITLKIVDAEKKTLACKIELTQAGDAPTEYSWEGLEFKGAWVNDWSDVHVLTADKVQIFNITANNAGNEFGFFPKGAGNAWSNTDLVFDTRTEMSYGKNENSSLSNSFESGASYEVKIELTDNNFAAPKAYITITKK